MLSVNGEIMIRSFVLLFAVAVFTSRGAAAGDVVLAANQVLLTVFFVGWYFLDGLLVERYLRSSIVSQGPDFIFRNQEDRASGTIQQVDKLLPHYLGDFFEV